MTTKQKISLSDLISFEVPVEVAPGKVLTVRALTLAEIIQLIVQYKDAAFQLYNEAQTDNPNYPAVLVAVPAMVADIIAYGGDMQGQQDDILKLAPSIQLQLLEAIWSASVPDPKKLIESLSKLTAQAQRLAASVQPSQPSVGTPT